MRVTKLKIAEESNLLGPAVQSTVSLTSSLVVKMSSALVSTISNSKVFLLKKCECSKNISIYDIFNDQSFNVTLTNDIVSFEKLGPEQYILASFGQLHVGLYSDPHIYTTKRTN